MAILVVLFLVSLVLPILIGWYCHRHGFSVAGGPQAWGAAAARRFGAVGGTVVALAVGAVAVIGIGLPLGFLAKALESSLDKPVFRWVNPRVTDSGFTTLNNKLTLIGNTTTVELVCLVAGIVLVFAYRRRWWLPVLAIAVAFYGERYAQKLLSKVVDRGHPPTTLGTYPSGGVGRILAVYGVLVFLIILLSPRMSRAWRAGLWTGLVTAATVESFTRVYLSKHWFTDAVFALIFGAILLVTGVAAISALTSSRRSEEQLQGARHAAHDPHAQLQHAAPAGTDPS